MNIKKLENNEELQKYLFSLRDMLNKKGNLDLAEKVDYATHFFNGSTSEFLTEAENALNVVKKSQNNNLSKEEILQINVLLNQIRLAFNQK